MQSPPTSDHDLLIRVATLLDRVESDIDDIKRATDDLPDFRRRVKYMEDEMHNRLQRNNALIIAAASVISVVISIVVSVILH